MSSPYPTVEEEANTGLFAPPRIDYENADDDLFDLPEEVGSYDSSAEDIEEAADYGEAFTDPEPEEEPEVEAAITVPTPRYYQKEAEEAVFDQFRQGVKSTLVVMATGSGKTPVISRIARRTADWGHNVLVLCHRDELITQARKHLGAVGLYAIREQAFDYGLPLFKQHSGNVGAVVCASVPTLKGDRLAQWPRDAFQLIISDEAHHGVSPTWRKIVEHFDKARHVGFTATADRTDGINIGRMFQTVAYEYNLLRATQDGYLVPLDCITIETDIDLSDLRVTSSGGFNTSELDERFAVQENIGKMVNLAAKYMEGRSTIFFLPDIKSAYAGACALRDIGITADYVASKRHDGRQFKRHDRLRIAEAFRTNQLQGMTNAMVWTEGADFPNCSCVVLARPTNSRSLTSQMVGRGTRLCPEIGKVDCRIIDFAYNLGKHKLVSPVELYDDGEGSEEVIERARELVKSGEERDPMQALKKAEEEEEVRIEHERRIRVEKAQYTPNVIRFDPLGVANLLGIKKLNTSWLGSNGKTVTPAQKEFLERRGVKVPDDLPIGAAGKLITGLKERQEKGLCSIKQEKMLVNVLGVPLNEAKNYTFEQAKNYIDLAPKPDWFKGNK